MSMSVFKTMKLVPLTVKTLHHRIIRNTVMGPRRQPLIINRSYSTTPTGRTKKPWTDAMNVLYNRISSLADQRITISLFLNHWVLEGQPVNKNQLREFIKELRFHKRYAHALEVYIYVCVCVCVCDACILKLVLIEPSGFLRTTNLIA